MPSPLSCAIVNRQFNAVKLLLEQGASPDIPIDEDHYNALHYAIYYNYEEIFMLVKDYANFDSNNDNILHPLFFAAECDNDILGYLLENEDCNIFSEINGYNLLMQCGFYNRTEALLMLTNKYNFDVNQEDCDGNDALYYALEGRSPEAIDVIYPLYKKINLQVFVLGMQYNNFQVLDKLIKNGFDINNWYNFRSFKNVYSTDNISYLVDNGFNFGGSVFGYEMKFFINCNIENILEYHFVWEDWENDWFR